MYYRAIVDVLHSITGVGYGCLFVKRGSSRSWMSRNVHGDKYRTAREVKGRHLTSKFAWKRGGLRTPKSSGKKVCLWQVDREYVELQEVFIYP